MSRTATVIGVAAAVLLCSAWVMWRTSSAVDEYPSSPKPASSLHGEPLQAEQGLGELTLEAPASQLPRTTSEEVQVHQDPVDTNQNPPQQSAGKTGFLPFPNQGVPDYERKYAGLTPDQMESTARELNVLLTAEVEAAAERKFSVGLSTVDYVDLSAPKAHAPDVPEPTGVGRTWKVTKTDPTGTVSTTFVTELEHPEIFAHSDEKHWLVRQWLKQGGVPGH